MRKMTIAALAVAVLMVFCVCTASFAQSITASVSNASPQPGETITVTINSSYFVTEGYINPPTLVTSGGASPSTSANGNMFLLDQGESVTFTYTVSPSAKAGDALNFTFSNVNGIASDNLAQVVAVNLATVTAVVGGAAASPTPTPIPTPTPNPVYTPTPIQTPVYTYNPVVTTNPYIYYNPYGAQPMSQPAAGMVVGNGWEMRTTVTPSVAPTKAPSGSSSSSYTPPKTADATPMVWTIGISAMAAGAVLMFFTLKKMLRKN